MEAVESSTYTNNKILNVGLLLVGTLMAAKLISALIMPRSKRYFRCCFSLSSCFCSSFFSSIRMDLLATVLGDRYSAKFEIEFGDDAGGDAIGGRAAVGQWVVGLGFSVVGLLRLFRPALNLAMGDASVVSR